MLTSPIILLISALLSWAACQHGARYSDMPVFALCAVWIFALQWLAFIPAYLRQTEKFYDLTGSITYIGAVTLALWLSEAHDPRSLLLGACVVVWAGRLGSFLFARVSQDGGDARFDAIKPSALRFFNTWNLQGLWVLLTAGAALAAISAERAVPLGPSDLLAILLWCIGFAVEVTADRQKRVFRKAHGRQGFITSGLWARSRHPNYFGEIVLWLGVALLALPALSGWQYLTLISPFFVYLLLSRVSGVPLLERRADQRWGDDPAYQQYKAATPVLIPRLFR